MVRKLLPLIAMLIGCSPSASPAPGQPPATANNVVKARAAREVGGGEHPWAEEDRRIPPGKERFTGELFAELPFAMRGGAPQRLSRDTLAYLEMEPGHYVGARVLASRERVMRIEEPKDLARFCVARDGRATFAVQQGNKLLAAPSFDAPMRSLGAVETEVNGAFLVVSEAGKRSFVDCRRGTVEDVSTTRGHLRILHHSETATLLQVAEDYRRSCRMRAGGATAWEEVAACSHASVFPDGLVRVYLETPDGSTKCGFAIDEAGKRRPCGDYGASYRPAPAESPIDFRLARFAAPNLLALTSEKGISTMPATGARSDLKLVVPGFCSPVVTISPLFRCRSEDGRTLRIVAIDTNGNARDELKIAIRGGQEPPFFETAGGALATGGECDGTPGDAACVRQPNGEWKTVRFAADLVTALHTMAPATLILPTVSGELFVGTGVTDGLLSIGPVELLVYKADKGLSTRAGKVPTWIVGDVTRPGGIAPSFVIGGDQNKVGSFLWRSATTLSAWPLHRLHPAFHTPESCRFDVSLDGSINVACVPGRAHAVGRFGVVEKKRGELLETYDGGKTWFQVPLPEGLNTSDVDCAAIGCRIGPYFRLGWGL